MVDIMLSRSSSGTSSGTEEDKGLVAPFPQAQAQEEEEDDDVANEDEARIDSPLFFFFVSFDLDLEWNKL